MDQQTFQSIECVVSDRYNRGRSSQKEGGQQQSMLSPKQNIIYVRNVQQSQLPSREFQMSQQPQKLNINELVKTNQETEFYKNKCILYEKQLNELAVEVNKYRMNPVQEKVTIVEDTQRVGELERQLQMFQAEVNRLNILIREQSNELEQWRFKGQQLNQQIFSKQGLEQEYERMKKVSTDNEQYLKNEIQRLNVLVSQSQSQLQQMQVSLIDAKKYEAMCIQQQNTQNQLANELERITGVLKTKSEEYETYKVTTINQLESLTKRLKDFETEVKEYRQKEPSYNLTIERLNRDNNDLSIEIRNKQEEILRLSQITQTLQITLQDTSKFQEYEARSKMQQEEIGVLNSRLRGKQDEVDKLKQQINVYQQQLQEYSRYLDYEAKYTTLLQENDRVNNSLRMKIDENDHLRSCIAKLQITLNDNVKIEDYENKIALQGQEIDRLHQSLRSKQDELERIRQETQQYIGEINRLSQINKQIREDQERSRVQYNDNQLKDYQSKVSLLTNEIERLTQQLRNKNDEIEKVRSTLQQYQQQEYQKIKDLEQKNVVYSNEIERLSNLIKVKMNESEGFRSDSQKAKELANRLQLVCNENERLTQINRQLCEDMDICRRKLLTQEDSVTLNERISSISQELDSWKQQFVALNREYHKNQEALILAQAELDSAKRKTKDQENFTVSKKSSQYQIGTLTTKNI
ncbi:hypothetical protein pb186bvf_011854 [Paramecium bursaria]